jgi:hypothetical protein
VDCGLEDVGHLAAKVPTNHASNCFNELVCQGLPTRPKERHAATGRHSDSLVRFSIRHRVPAPSTRLL